MATEIITKGTTSQLIEVVLRSSTTGQPLTGIAFGSVTIKEHRQGASPTTRTAIIMTAGTWASIGWVETSDTGVYQFGVPDAGIATGADSVTYTFTAAGAITATTKIVLTDVDFTDSVRGGMTAFPNANADAPGGVPISDAGGLDMDAMNTNVNDIETIVAALNDLSAADLATALTDIHLDHLFAVDYDPATIPGVSGAWANEAVEDDGAGNMRFTSKILENAPASGGGFVRGVYRWSTDITATNPGAGVVKVDNATYASVTEVYINDLTDTGFNGSAFIEALGLGDKLLIARENNGGQFIEVAVTGPPTDNTGWWTVPVSYVDSGTTIGNNNTAIVLFAYEQSTAAEIAAAVWANATRTLTALGFAAVDANVVSIISDTGSATKLKEQFDGATGVVGDTYPATQAQLDNVANVGSAVHKPAFNYTLTTGTQTANLFTDTEALDSVRHAHTDAGGVMDLEYHFRIGGGTPGSVQITGYVTNNSDDIDVFGYDWVTTSYKQIGNIQGSNSTANSVYSFDLFVDMVGSGANEGKVDIMFGKTSGLSSATLAIDQIFIAFSQGVEGYDNGAVWFDSNASNTGTEVNIDGTARNPVSTSAAVLTLLASTGLHKVEVAPGSTFNLSGAYEGVAINGNGAILTLNNQDIGGSVFERFGRVTGVGTTTGNPTFFQDCIFGLVTTPPGVHQQCGYGSTHTIGSTGDITYVDCYSDVAGSGSPIFTKTALVVLTSEWRRYSGGVTVNNIEATDTLTIGEGLGTVTLNGVSGVVEIRGIYKAIVDNRTGSPTLNIDGAIKGVDVASVLLDTNELQTDDIPGLISALNNFDPAVDTVARVTLVDTTTVNTDMRGTDVPVPSVTYYVRTDGSNGNNGLTDSAGGAWLTIEYALGQVADGDVIIVADGTYTGQIAFNFDFAREVLVQAQGSTAILASGTNLLHTTAATSNVTFDGFTLTHGAAGNQYLWRVTSGDTATNIKFKNCSFDAHASYAGTLALIQLDGPTIGTLFEDVTFNGAGSSAFMKAANTSDMTFRRFSCQLENPLTRAFIAINNLNGDLTVDNFDVTYGAGVTSVPGGNGIIYVFGWGDNGHISIKNSRIDASVRGNAVILNNNTITNQPFKSITVDNCDIRATTSAFLVTGLANNVSLTDTSFVTTNAVAIAINQDGQAGYYSNGLILDNVFAKSTSGHACLIGRDLVGFSIKNSRFVGGDHALVVKAESGIIIDNIIESGTLGGLYFKGARKVNATLNKIRSQVAGGYCFGVAKETTAVPNIVPEHCSLYNNEIIAESGTTLFSIAADADIGASILENNNSLSGSIGTIRGAGVAGSDRSDLITAWGGYTVVGNGEIATSGGDDAATIYAYFIAGSNEDVFKADVSGLATAASIAILNDFNPTTDTVANVALVGTTTTNTDMRGTDNALLAASAPSDWSNMVISATGVVNANMEEISGSSVVESSAGRIVGNFNGFFNNMDVLSGQTQDDVGAGAGGSFWSTTEQANIRQALGVDGTKTAGGTDGDVQEIKTTTDQFAFTIPNQVDANTLSSSVSSSACDEVLAKLSNTSILNIDSPLPNKITIVRGDSYDGTAHPSFTWDTGKDLTGATVRFTIRDGRTDAAVLTVAGTFAGTVAIVSLTSAQTNPLKIARQKFDVQVIYPSGSVETIALGQANIIEDQTRN